MSLLLTGFVYRTVGIALVYIAVLGMSQLVTVLLDDMLCTFSGLSRLTMFSMYVAIGDKSRCRSQLWTFVTGRSQLCVDHCGWKFL